MLEAPPTLIPLNHRVAEGGLRVHIRFCMTEPRAALARAERPDCFVQLLALEVSTGRTIVLGAERLLPPVEDPEQLVTIRCAPLPAARYRLMGIVMAPSIRALHVALGPELLVHPS
jgi:hypothetical protein